jgi:TonB family protein
MKHTPWLTGGLAGCLLLVFVQFAAQAQEEGEGYCMACSREAWAGDSVALNKFIASCGMVDTVGYDSLDVVVKEKPVVQKITMKLNSGKVLYSDSVYLVPDQLPEYPGGFEAMLGYLKNNLRFPDEAARQKISGTVFVEFIVERDGAVRQVRVLRGIGYGCDQEAARVVKTMQGWKPGLRKGKEVRVKMNLPVRFSMM